MPKPTPTTAAPATASMMKWFAVPTMTSRVATGYSAASARTHTCARRQKIAIAAPQRPADVQARHRGELVGVLGDVRVGQRTPGVELRRVSM